jgi:hypothetical protein
LSAGDGVADLPLLLHPVSLLLYRSNYAALFVERQANFIATEIRD